MDNKAQIKWVPRKTNLDINDIDSISPLYEAQLLHDLQLEKFHKKGASLVINHSISTKSYGNVMFTAPNPIEFYIYGARKSLDQILAHSVKVENQLFKNNALLFEMISYLMYAYSALEAFVNQNISQRADFHEKHNCEDVENLEKKMSIENKIKNVLKLKTSDMTYWSEILDFVKLRHDVVHLKSLSKDSDFKSYESVYVRLLDFKYSQSFVSIKKLMKEVSHK